MAFTLAHPAAVAPLRKLSLLAWVPLAVGSLTPDLIKALPYSWEMRLPPGHSLIGTLLTDLPAGYLLLVLLLLLRGALLKPLWEPHTSVAANALDNFYQRSGCWWLAAPSLWLGSLSHVIWDHLTHESRWTYRHLPSLYEPMFPDASHELPLYHFLQYFTSALGLAYLVWLYLRTLKQNMVNPMPLIPLGNFKVVWFAGLLVLALCMGASRLMSRGHASESIYESLSIISRTTMIGFAALYVCTGLLMSVNASLRRASP